MACGRTASKWSLANLAARILSELETLLRQRLLSGFLNDQVESPRVHDVRG